MGTHSIHQCLGTGGPTLYVDPLACQKHTTFSKMHRRLVTSRHMHVAPCGGRQIIKHVINEMQQQDELYWVHVEQFILVKEIKKTGDG